MPHCATETPVSSSPPRTFELAFRAIVAFEHALDPVARAHTHTHARTHLVDHPLAHGHSPFNTLPVQGFPDEFRSTDPTVSFFWDTRPITSFTIKIISISDSGNIPPLLFTLLAPSYIYIYSYLLRKWTMAR